MKKKEFVSGARLGERELHETLLLHALQALLSHCLHPALTQRAHYYQWRAVDPRRHSYEGCLKALPYAHSPSVND